MKSVSCSNVVSRKTGAVSRMKSFQNWPGSSSCSGGGPRRMSRSSNPFSSRVPAKDSSTTKTTRWPRSRSTSPIPTQLLVGPKAPSGKKTIVRSLTAGAYSGPRAARLRAAGELMADELVRPGRPVAQQRAGVARVDDLLNREALGGAEGRADGVQPRLDLLPKGDWVLGGLQLAAVGG